jgi:hypothetical protein
VYHQELARTEKSNEGPWNRKRKADSFLNTVATARASTSTLVSEIVKFPSEINNEMLVIWNRYTKIFLSQMCIICNSKNYK